MAIINKKLVLINLVILILSLSLFNCIGIYTPTMQHVPMIKEKNEINANISLTNLQLSYSPTNNFALMVSGSSFSGDNRTDNSYSVLAKSDYNYNNRSKIIEGGIGYFKTLSNDFTWNIFGGAGFGTHSLERFYLFNYDTSSQTFYNSKDYKTSLKSTKLFIQPSFGYSSSFIEYTFSGRISLIKFSSIETTNYVIMRYEDRFKNINDSPFLTFEPAFTVKVGYKYVKFFTQVMYTVSFQNKSLPKLPLRINVGLHLTLAKRFKE